MTEPTSEQVEEVARAIWVSSWERVQARLPAGHTARQQRDHWETATDYTRDAHRRHARAAITAWEQATTTGGNDHV